ADRGPGPASSSHGCRLPGAAPGPRPGCAAEPGPGHKPSAGNARSAPRKPTGRRPGLAPPKLRSHSKSLKFTVRPEKLSVTSCQLSVVSGKDNKVVSCQLSVISGEDKILLATDNGQLTTGVRNRARVSVSVGN